MTSIGNIKTGVDWSISSVCPCKKQIRVISTQPTSGKASNHLSTWEWNLLCDPPLILIRDAHPLTSKFDFPHQSPLIPPFRRFDPLPVHFRVIGKAIPEPPRPTNGLKEKKRKTPYGSSCTFAYQDPFSKRIFVTVLLSKGQKNPSAFIGWWGRSKRKTSRGRNEPELQISLNLDKHTKSKWAACYYT